MDAVPKRWFRRTMADILSFTGEGTNYWRQSGDLMNPNYGTDGLILKCEMADPPSMRGRNVNVWIRGEEVEWLMKLCREVAIARRNKPMDTV